MGTYLKSAIAHRWDSTNLKKITLTLGIDLYVNMQIDDSNVPAININENNVVNGNIIVNLDIDEDLTVKRGNMQKTKFYEYEFTLVNNWNTYPNHIISITLNNPDFAAERDIIETQDAPSY